MVPGTKALPFKIIGLYLLITLQHCRCRSTLNETWRVIDFLFGFLPTENLITTMPSNVFFICVIYHSFQLQWLYTRFPCSIWKKNTVYHSKVQNRAVESQNKIVYIITWTFKRLSSAVVCIRIIVRIKFRFNVGTIFCSKVEIKATYKANNKFNN